MVLLNALGKTESISPEERHQRLIKASNDYMTGKIDSREFRDAESRYMTDYNAVTLELGSLSRAAREFFKRFTVTH